MNFFEEAALRLKQQLKLTEDRQVAEAIGMTSNAWTMRKRRGSFPEKELRAAAQQRPDLQIDVDYVLTGGLAGQNVAAAMGRDPRALMGHNVDVAMGRDPEAMAGPVAMALATGAQAVKGDEARLLAAFRAADSAGRAAILMAATGIASLAQN